MDLVTFETAKLAKEKGFDLETQDYFAYQGFKKNQLVEYISLIPFNHNSNNLHISRPFQSHLQKWLRKEHNIDITIWIRYMASYGVLLHKDRIKIGDEIIVTPTAENRGRNLYEIALEKGLIECLKLI